MRAVQKGENVEVLSFNLLIIKLQKTIAVPFFTFRFVHFSGVRNYLKCVIIISGSLGFPAIQEN